MLKRPIILFTMLLAASMAFAGDIATFVNLGFSDDSTFFMFGQYGLDQGPNASYADIFTVDNVRNAFVPKGVLKSTNNAPLDIGQDGSGLFYNLLYENAANAKKYRIDHLNQGRLLYVLLDGEEPKSELSFRDFKTQAEYGISLGKKFIESGDTAVSSFSLRIEVVEPSGAVKRVDAGSPSIKRPGVTDYVIRRVILSPDSRYLVVVIEKKTQAPEGSSVRYMVEPVKIR
jgi:predicted secreted protein